MPQGVEHTTKPKLYNMVESFQGSWHVERRQSAPESRTYCGRLIVPKNRYRGDIASHGALCVDCLEKVTP